MPTEKAIFQRTELLLGEETIARIAQKHVIIFGTGGVGSWCAEGLVRSGIHHLTLVDSDCVCISNINRQLMATTATVGQIKVEALRERLLSINPNCNVIALQKVFCEETADEFFLPNDSTLPEERKKENNSFHYDYVIDAIDSLKEKALLIRRATASSATFFASMGAALKSDASRIRVTEFWKVQGDPLARALRKRFKHEGLYPKRKFMCVYSDELLENKGTSFIDEPSFSSLQEKPADSMTNNLNMKKAQVNGTLAHITAIFGFTLTGLVINDICKRP